jgi:endonuclease/exonuclease/phosphatase (EEP) superfamily protein YafD
MTRGAGLGLSVLAAVALSCGPPPPLERPRPAAGIASLRLLTYNVNFGIAGDAATLAAIRDARADLALLQETNAGWEHEIRAALAGDFPYMHFDNRGGAGGMAVLSRFRFVAVELIRPTGDGWFPATRVVVDGPFGRVQALSVHLHPPVSEGGSILSGHFTTPAVRAAEIAGFFARLDPQLPAIVAGDFNEEEDGRAMRFLAANGMASALARFAPDRPTWRWDTALGRLHRQFDHVTVDARLDVLSAEVRDAGRSDHLPVVAVIAAARTK